MAQPSPRIVQDSKKYNKTVLKVNSNNYATIILEQRIEELQ